MPKQIDDNHVYHAALLTVIEKGYAGATTRVIAEAAGVNEVTLFRKYGSKAELIAAAISHEVVGERGGTVEFTGDVIADLTVIVHSYMSTSELHSRLFPLIMSEISRYPELRQTMSGPLSFINQIGDLLGRYQSDGLLIDEDKMMSVLGLLGPAIVYGMLRRADPEFPMSEFDLQLHIESFVKGRTPN